MKVLLINDDTLKTIDYNDNDIYKFSDGIDGNDIYTLSDGLEFRGYELEVINATPSNIVDYVKKHNIDIIITNNESIATDVFSSLSIGTSTYVISNNLNIDNKNAYRTYNPEDAIRIIDTIAKNRKPSEEQRWNRHYTDEQLKKPFPERSGNDYVRDQNIDLSACAMEYFGTEETYGRMFSNWVSYAKKLTCLGVKPGDYVTCCMANTPEFWDIYRAIQEVGAVCNNIDPRANAKEILHVLRETNSKIMFALDSKYKEINSIIDMTNLNKVFLMSPFERVKKLAIPYNAIQKLKGNRPNDSGYRYFNDFLRTMEKDYTHIPYYKGIISSIQYTSGTTTGIPKAVEMTSDSFNARAHQLKLSDLTFEKNGRILQHLPISGVAYGEFMMQIGLANQMRNTLVPMFTPEGLGPMMNRLKIEYISTTPNGYFEIINHPQFKNSDYSELKMVVIGGGGLIPKYEDKINKVFASQGFKGHVLVGDGGTEPGITSCTETDKFQKLGTSGIPLIGNGVKVLRPDGTECGYKERGSIYYDNVSPMLGYRNNPELTKEAMTEHGIFLDDYGSIDEDGFSTVYCRNRDLIKLNGEIICPRDLEELTAEIPGVNLCTVVNLEGQSQIGRICFVSDFTRSIKEVTNDIREALPEYLKDKIDIVCIRKIPSTPNGKTDKRVLTDGIDEIRYTKGSRILKRKQTW